ncbi:MAG: DUF1579 domain-containing protein [Candidatus Omnitrophota bacterium]|nr:DUF1579 domain-containing protein [Candidatus Omnitrophota bacterium]MDZ4243361.1 DUF1579 domain-containing protein [Candidatus Omnitrophota bacterium]
MKKFFLLSLTWSIALAAGILFASPARAEEKPPAAASTEKAGMDETMMAKWQEYSTPAEGHKALEQFVGKWDHTVKWWMKPNSEPEVSTGQSEIQWMLSGRFLKHEATGTSMGQPFEGLGIYGYDNAKKQYTSLWLDNMGTGIMKSFGQYDEAAKMFTETGKHTCPLSENNERVYRGVTKFTDADHYTYEFYTLGEDGKEFRAMEITYSRAK